MRVFVMTDLEGATGVSGRWEVFNPGALMHAAAVRHLTGDVNAALAGAFEAGAEAATVLDGHGAGFSIDLDALDPRAELLQGRRTEEISGLDGSYDVMFIVGAHAMVGTPEAMLDHTFSSSSIVEYRLDGEPIGEAGVWAAWAGDLGVPVALVTGDRAATEEIESLLPHVEVVAVKEGVSRYYARLKHPSVTAKLIKEAAAACIAKCLEGTALGKKLPAWAPSGPREITVTYADTHMAATAAAKPGVRRIDGRTVSASHETVRGAMALVRP